MYNPGFVVSDFNGWYETASNVGSPMVNGYNLTNTEITELFAKQFSLEKVTGITAKSASHNSVKLTWNKVEGAAGYEVYKSTKKAGTYTLAKKISSGNTVSYADTGLKTGTVYYYKIVATNRKCKIRG